MENIFHSVGLMDPNPGSALSSQENRARNEVSPEAVWGDVGTKFPHPEMVVISIYTS